MKKSAKIIIGLLIAFVIGISTTVGATTIFNSKDITYSSDKTEATNVKDSLDELYSKVGNNDKCPEGTTCLKLISNVQVGDYIFYSPRGKNFTISKSLTGADVDQTIDPSEFYLWLVLKKNDDGTVEAISVSGADEGVGNTWLALKGTIGYKKFVGVLNDIVLNITDHNGEIFDAYGERPFGYKDQLWTCTAINTATACPTDVGYFDDLNSFYVAASKHENDFYESWLASREWKDARNLNLRYMDYNGKVSSYGVLVNNVAKTVSSRLRPIVTFNKNVLVEAREGTRDKPLRILDPSHSRS